MQTNKLVWKRWLSVLLLAIAVAILVMALPLPGRARANPTEEIQRVVVIHFDTTRMDDFGSYGGIARTPNIDAVAARGLRFTNSITPVPKTSPSIASFMTGRLANRHGVYDVGAKLRDEFTTLPELLSDNGFVTAGFVSNPVVDRLHSAPTLSTGFDQGFDEFTYAADLPETVPDGTEPNAAPRVACKKLVNQALEFVDTHQDDRFFLWMLHMDPHAPYAPPAPWDTMYLDDPELIAASVRPDPGEIHHKAYVSTWLDSHEYVARHLGEVTMTDYWLGKLLRRIEELPGRTLLIITADHGESLGDAGYWFGHGHNIRHACVNVPLIIACDGLVPIGVSHALVANIDLAPTILELLDLPADDLVANGQSLTAAFDRTDPWPDRMIPIQSYAGRRWRGVRSADFCLQSEFDSDTGRRLRTLLYDRKTDPLESTDVTARYPRVLDSLLETEQAWFGQGLMSQVDLRDHEEMIRRLKSVGYMK